MQKEPMSIERFERAAYYVERAWQRQLHGMAPLSAARRARRELSKRASRLSNAERASIVRDVNTVEDLKEFFLLQEMASNGVTRPYAEALIRAEFAATADLAKEVAI